jgi:hypothetical protein
VTRTPWSSARGRRLGWLGLLVLLVGALWLLGPSSGSGRGGPVSWRSGVFSGYGPFGDRRLARWRRAPVQVATDFTGSDNWGQIEDPAWAIAQWGRAKGVRPDLSVALWPATGGSLADAAAGAYNPHFAALARNLVAGGLARAGLRLGWEFNATWYRWSVATPADAADYAAAWRQIVTAMRSVPGARFSFDWAVNRQPGGVDPALSYPGDAYVTAIGMDVYDWNDSGLTETPSQRWHDLVHKGYGLAWQSRFAGAHHKPIAFPEWALVSYAPKPAVAGGDDPSFIEHMFGWFKSHNVAFEDYFNYDPAASGTYYGIATGNQKFPKAAATYKELYAR